MEKFNFISLGCAKTRVDSEYMVSLLEKEGYEYSEIGEADFIVLNTCSFIESAREESVDTILQLSSEKKSNQKLIVVGCLPQRYGDSLSESLPEVYGFVGTSSLNEIVDIFRGSKVNSVIMNKKSWIPRDLLLRKGSINPYISYVKIAEGCNRQCAYCAVPGIRGKQQSFSTDMILNETKLLVENGVKEINLIAQDLTAYGIDLSPRETLENLVTRLSQIEDLEWIRLLYLYPTMISDELIDIISGSTKVVPYLDIPIQHLSDGVLKSMARGYSGKQVFDTIARIRKVIPDIFLRTTILVGHPGENEKDFKILYNGLKELEFDHLGVFSYSPEEGTSAYNQNHPEFQTTESRREEILTLQNKISFSKLKNLGGKILPVLVEQYDEDSMVFTGRHWGQAPEVDGIVYLNKGDFTPGEIINLKITDNSEYDLIAEPIVGVE